MRTEEEAAFAEYMTARRDAVRRTAYLLCGEWHKADDLTQTAFVKLYGAWGRIRDRGALDAYVRSCLVRATIDESRRPWRRERAVEFLPEPHPSAGGSADLADFAGGLADRDAVREALRQVPPGQRTVLVLRYYEGLDVKAVAQALGCSDGTVKSQTSRGLAALKAALAVTGTTPERREGEGR
ncbi:SigE family RNA polymerase sigma factor [Nakamurella flavida]|uniref:SigE family RNA polymerase sigma factor n=1 Tax=Nakamurella flavida TaxID=363630 RepID=A0A938YH43_9ACTN|nr:SigE family RNA polymerase sigma factor [Nakamurella flavida]MBM9477576.1 SigE family RNA polymerase sigma factor [Nakamurella flavida]MDP9779124.1 RNA polymerase sigma-70 factor (sigma-E family) [Nakamurella flavida]